MKKIIVFIFISIIGFSFAINAQNMSSSYRTSLGAKGYFGDGSMGGINVKHFLDSRQAIEPSLLFSDNVVAFEANYEWHGPIVGASGLKWYVGPGAMIGGYDHDEGRFHEEDDGFLFALKGIVGLDYKFTGAPINIAFDVNPTWYIAPDSDFEFYAGLAFRFAF